ncbi:MAG: DUF1311 domain-containing protein [Bacillota bacterium]|jgi:uncharacterized protein YecT (DUF1311 family)
MLKKMFVVLLTLGGLLVCGTAALGLLGYDMSGQFEKLIQNNPLDRDYEQEIQDANDSPDFTTQKWVEIQSKYTKLWDAELNCIYQKLLAQLTETEKNLLIKSQKGWLQYHLTEQKLVDKTFYYRESGPIFGSQGRVQMVSAACARIRERTIELMEYYNMLGNEVEFEYQGKLPDSNALDSFQGSYNGCNRSEKK